MATTAKAKAAGPADKGLHIVSRSAQGFRRAGREFGPDGTRIALSELTGSELEALRNEAQLVVVDVDMPPPAKG